MEDNDRLNEPIKIVGYPILNEYCTDCVPPEALEFFIDPGNTTRDELQNLFGSINNLNIVIGGLGYKFHIPEA